MDPPELKNGSQAAVVVQPKIDDFDGSYVAVTLIKQRFFVSRRGEVVPSSPPPDIHIPDVFWNPDEPETSSIRFPSDLVIRKPSTDVLVVGNAVAPYRRPSPSLDVHLRVGDEIRKSVRVFGPRAWYRQGRNMVPTDPRPFEEMPIQWERAWGGADFETDPENPVEEPRNPNGVGLVADPATLEGTAVPNVEDPNDLITSHRSRPTPMGLCSIARHWSPRRYMLGTCDDQWMQERMPLLPLDFDPKFHQVAPSDQITREPLRGGERVELMHMNEQGPISFELPKTRYFVGLQTHDGLTEYAPQLDTLTLEPNDRTFTMTWRSTFPLPRRASRVRFVQVHEKRRI